MKWKGTIISISALVITMIICVTVLIALNKDPSVLIAALIPIVLILVNQVKMDEVHQDVKQVAENVNGRMSQLIESKTQPDTPDPQPPTPGV